MLKISRMRNFGLCCVAFLLFFAYSSTVSAIKVSQTQINVYDLRWVDDQVAIVLSYSYEVYRSNDTGQSWTKLSLPNASSASKPAFLYPSTVDSNKFYIRGSGAVSWVSEDKGLTWISVYPTNSYRNLMFHPTNANWAIAGVNVAIQSSGDVYITKDFCRSWTRIIGDVYQYSWGDTSQGSLYDQRIYLIKRTSEFRDFVYTDDLGQSFDVLASNSYTFVFLENQIFQAVYDFATTESTLFVSPSIGMSQKIFYEAEFPFGDELENNGYAILDDHTGAVYMGINHGDYDSHWGHVYVSDSIGYKYVLSSPHTRFVSAGGVPSYDFDRINGLEGIYLSNVLFNWDEEEAIQDEVQSFITLNNGGSWRQLNPPTEDMNGQPYVCTGPCYLHLHGWTSYSGEDTQYGPFYSVDNAIGLIIGSGNVGEFLSFERDDVRTYLSRDGGVTWKEIHSGPSIYEFADDGGILVLAPFGELTNTIYYSLDEATSPLVAYQLPVDPLDIDNIFTEPSATGTKFVISGSRNGAGYLIGVDFSDAFTRNCTDSDYELWAPSEGTTPVNGLNCQLGRQVIYQRRKPSAQCWNPQIDHIVNTTACECIEDDWECDFGYERASNGSCYLVMEPPTYPPENCEGSYYKTKGYRKVAGNSCKGGVDHSPAGPYSCDAESDIDLSSNKGWIAAVVIVPLVVLLVIGAFFAMRSEKLREKLPFLDALQSWKDGYLKVNATPGESVLDEEYIVGPLDEEVPAHDRFEGQDHNDFDPRN